MKFLYMQFNSLLYFIGRLGNADCHVCISGKKMGGRSTMDKDDAGLFSEAEI